MLLRLTTNMLELGVAIRMACSFQSLAIGLKAIAQGVEELCHHSMTRLVSHSLQFRSQMPNTLGGPPQGGLRIAALCRTDEFLQILLQRRVDIYRLLASSSRPSDSTGMRSCWRLKLFNAATDRFTGNPGGARHDGDSPEPKNLGLRSGRQTTSPLVERGSEKFEPPPNRVFIAHSLPRIQQKP